MFLRDLARSAEWPLARAEQLSASYRKEFMLRGEEKMRAGPRLREVVRFAQVNLNELGRQQPVACELIFCRNVLIYFNSPLQDRVQKLFLDSLEMFGILGLGKKETVRYSAVADAYEEIDAEERLYRRIL